MRRVRTPTPVAHPLEMFGIVSWDSHAPRGFPADVSVVSFRDLGAVVADTSWARPTVSEPGLERYRRAVEGVFASASIVPAPYGTVFRSREALLRWLELHYFTLIEALTFLDDRAMARVGVSYAPPGGAVGVPVTAGEIDGLAAPALAQLRRHAVASLPLAALQDGEAPEARAAFLIERERWEQFRELVVEEQRRQPTFVLRCTGPWPPYDFVRLQFGG